MSPDATAQAKRATRVIKQPSSRNEKDTRMTRSTGSIKEPHIKVGTANLSVPKKDLQNSSSKDLEAVGEEFLG